MAAEAFLANPKIPPNLNIPPSPNTVQVSVIDSTAFISIPSNMFVAPDYPSFTHLSAPAYSFLIQHSSGKTLLFDLAVRKDWENAAPAVLKPAQEHAWTLRVEKDVATILDEHNIGRHNIHQIIWSHPHFDHTGDPSVFPRSTDLVVGPGFKDAYMPGYPEDPDSTVCSSAWEGRRLVEISFEKDTESLKIGRFGAFDYFGDGSFYLLNTPGHTVGHLCGLARVTSNPDTFVYMGGDTCHHGGEFRPTPYLPLPKEISPSPIPHVHASICPGALFENAHRNQKADEPFYVPTEVFNWDMDLTRAAIDGMEEFDAQENVLTVIAHDESLLSVLDFFPKTINTWKDKELAIKGRWGFLKDFEGAVR